MMPTMIRTFFQPLAEDMGRLDNGGRQDVPGDWARKGAMDEKNFQRHYFVRVLTKHLIVKLSINR